MSKKEIDNYISDNYDYLIKIAKAHIYKNNRAFKPEELITNLYLYLTKKKTHIQNKKQLEIWSSRYIMTQCQWQNSETNKQQNINNHSQGKFVDDYTINISDENDDYQDKIQLEEWYSKRKCELQEYRHTINNKVDAIFFDVYFNKLENNQKVTVRAIAEHFNISPTPAHHLIKDMHNKIKEYSEQKDKNKQ